MVILGLHQGHDAAAALFVDGELVSYCKEERMTRLKNDGKRLELAAIDEVLRIAGKSRRDIDVVAFSRTHFPLKLFKKTKKAFANGIRKIFGRTKSLSTEMYRLREPREESVLNYEALRAHMGLREDCGIHFVNHHRSHVLGAFKYTTWADNALYLSCDGGGDNLYYSAYSWDGEALTCLWGEDEAFIKHSQSYAASIGRAYTAITVHLGFKAARHEGKITGLAALGEPVLGEAILNTFAVRDDGSVVSSFNTVREWNRWFKSKAAGLSREDLAASIQYATEVLVVRWVQQLRALFPATRIGLSGGVFSNVRLNQRIAELAGIEEVFVFPAMGDEGLPVGNCVDVLIEAHGLASLSRSPLTDVYYGYDYSARELMQQARVLGLETLEPASVPEVAAKALEAGYVGAIFHGPMEMGPRALGARSIIASPEDRGINDSLNERLERTEFMPFAPFVLEEDASVVFGIDDRNRHACEFMTITTDVSEEFRPLIPAVVHVDGTARPQIVRRGVNPLYYDILVSFKALSGRPCLVNTSFNAHEEPIINTPAEAIRALQDDRVDFLVCEAGLVLKPGGPMSEWARAA